MCNVCKKMKRGGVEVATVYGNWKTGEIYGPIPKPTDEWLAENLYAPLIQKMIAEENKTVTT